MLLNRTRIASMMCALLLSVSALAVPIDVSSYEVTVPVTTAVSDLDATTVNHSYFIVAEPYVVTLDVATHVPIVADDLARLDARNYSSNLAVMQNVNFERTSSY